ARVRKRTVPSCRTFTITPSSPLAVAVGVRRARNLNELWCCTKAAAGIRAQKMSFPSAGRSWRRTSWAVGVMLVIPAPLRIERRRSLLVSPRGTITPRERVRLKVCDSLQQAGSSRSVRPLPSLSMQSPQISAGVGSPPSSVGFPLSPGPPLWHLPLRHVSSASQSASVLQTSLWHLPFRQPSSAAQSASVVQMSLWHLPLRQPSLAAQSASVVQMSLWHLPWRQPSSAAQSASVLQMGSPPGLPWLWQLLPWHALALSARQAACPCRQASPCDLPWPLSDAHAGLPAQSTLTIPTTAVRRSLATSL